MIVLSISIFSMSTLEQRRVDTGSAAEEKGTSSLDEKHPDTATVVSVDSKDADEALELVGTTRTSHFTEEYNAKLRRKLVSLRPTRDVARCIYLIKPSFRTGLSRHSVLPYTSLNFCRPRPALLSPFLIIPKGQDGAKLCKVLSNVKLSFRKLTFCTQIASWDFRF